MSETYPARMDPSAQDQQADRTVRLAVDLVNLRTRLKESPLDAAVLRRFLADHGEQAPIRLDRDDAAAIGAVEAELRAVFDAPDVDAARLINRLLAEDGTARLGRCAAPGCRRVFAGGPRNHRRRYCSPACGNAARVAAFRDRRRGRTGGRVTDPVSGRGRRPPATGP
jgi:predicted RNA-binding Zn ribbon-like protein